MNVQHQRHLALGLAVTVALTGVLLLRQWMPERRGTIGTIPTGASFNLAVARYRSGQQAVFVAANVQAAGLPAFTRTLRAGGRDGVWRQVIVGPYVSIDEAESAQRLLARLGFGRARLLVDESVRRMPGTDGAAIINVSAPSGPLAGRTGPLGPGAPAVVLVAGAGRISVVLEMPVEPRQVTTRRPEGTVLEVDAGPVTNAIAHQEWNAPDGVGLINQVSVERHEGPHGALLRTRVMVPALTQSNVRVVGRRVYIDFWAPDSRGGQPLLARQRVPVVEDDEEEDAPEGDPAEQYFDAIAPVVTRVGEIEPFLLSAAASPAPDVLAAVGKTLGSVQAWIRTIEAPKESASTHHSLIEAINLAVQSVEPDFGGDRAGQARQAVMQFHAAAASYRPPITDN